MMQVGRRSAFTVFLFLTFCANTLFAADLYVGTGRVDITPDKICGLAGQWKPRFTKSSLYPLELNITLLESREKDQILDSALIVSMDTACVFAPMFRAMQDTVKKTVPNFDPNKLMVCATHTHSAPYLSVIPAEQIPKGMEIMNGPEYVEFVAKRFETALGQVLKTRQKAQYSYGLGHAVVALNRRAVYADGTAVMYGKTNRPDFRAVEGFEDHDVHSIFFWNMKNEPIAMFVSVACPSQEEEGNKQASSDFWGPVKRDLRQKFGKDIPVVTMCGAAGDMSPHLRYQQQAEYRMDRLRGLNRLEEIARRIVVAVDDTYNVVEKDKQTSPILKHKRIWLDLPERKVTKDEYESCKRQYESLLKSDPANGQIRWNKRIMARYEKLSKNPNPVFRVPVNVLRLGDTAICTNQFELYTDFATQIKAQSPAVETIVVQLTNAVLDPTDHMTGGSYLPSARAAQHGGYGAIVQSNTIGPEGGQILVEETLKTINEFWK